MKVEPDAVPPRRTGMTTAVVIGILAATAALTTILTAHAAFPHGTNDLDETAYQSQANTLAVGHLTLARATHDPFFLPFLSGVHGNRVVFKYQPVWPALVAASDGAFGSSMPLRVAMAIAGVLAVVWLGWELVRDRRVALIAGALMVASPFAWVQSASLLGYQLSFVLAAAADAALLRALRTQQWRVAFLAGALLGVAVLHRPFDAVIAAAPVLVYVTRHAWRSGALRTLSTPILAGAAPFAIAFLAYNQAVMGSLFSLPFNASGRLDRFGFGWRASFTAPGRGHGGQVHYTVGLAFSTLGHFLGVLPRFVALAPAVAACLAVFVRKRRNDDRARLLLTMILVIIVGYFFWWGVANAFRFGLDRSLGPFYHYPVLAPLFVAAAWGFTNLRTMAMKIAVVVVGLAWAVPASLVVLRDARDAGRDRTAELATLSLPGRAVVLEAPLFPGDPYVRFANDARLSGRRLVARDVPERRIQLVDRFPDRAPFLVRSFRNFDDPLGAMQRDRVPLSVTRGFSLDATLHATIKGGRAAAAYLRIGNAAPRFDGAGTAAINATWKQLSASALPAGTTEIAIGVTVAAPNAPPPTAMTGDWYECRFAARTGPDGAIEVLLPCEGWHHYLFPNGTTVTSLENVNSVLSVQVMPSH